MNAEISTPKSLHCLHEKMQALGMQLLLVCVGTLLWGVMLSPHKLMAAEPSESTASGSTVAGHVAFVNGQVMLNQPGKPNRPVQMGEPVFVGDRIQTQAKSQLHLRMVDNAFLAMRPSSQLVISAYQYDKDQPQASRIRIDLEQGTSRAVSGKGGQAAKNQYRFNTPLAAIGLRGTDYTVLADAHKTQVSVAQGGVIVSPIGPDCLISQLGPCISPLSRELTAATPNVFIEIKANQVPKVLQKQSDAGDSSKVANVNTLGSEASKPETLQQSIERKLVLEQVSNVDTATNVANQTARYESIAKWGRWSALVQQVPQGSDSINKAFAQIPNLEIVGSNEVFALAYPGNTMVRMPDQGKAQFSLVAAEAYIKDKDALTRVGVKSGQLEIDFAQNLFNSQVAVAISAFAIDTVKTQGSVDRFGRMTSNAALSNANVSGIVLNKGLEATYLFDKSLAAGGVLAGVVQWAR
jgi:hypothetical protein